MHLRFIIKFLKNLVTTRMKKFTAFLKNRDQLGSGVSLNYRGTPQFGTLLGGCISLLVSIFFALFVIISLYGWAFEPEYKEEISVSYLDLNKYGQNGTDYDIPTSIFLPTFILRTPTL